MKTKIMYIENKAYGHSGPAWIGFVEFSKSGQTIYFNGKALKRLKNTGTYGNHFDIETGEEYWVSGIKKNGHNRHQFGSGKIMLEKNSVDEYLKLVDFNYIDKNYFEIVECISTDKNKFNKIENREVEFRNNSYRATFFDSNHRKLILDI
ncbi:hypothetical protein [Chryseobacterium sp. G0186]|uniref:hypothetical protein n=1 Tax=Chryseobacterium sp. G0186 TaxID=2487064 RepID=UPI001E4AA149|nr:hypothetical protein [Chryseobacterium sp. G0186]